MNTKVLPNEIRRLLNQPRQYVYLLGLAVVIALGVVLFLTVLRVQNAKDTIGRPQASGNLTAECDKGDCGACAILVNSGELPDVEKCQRAKQALNCLNNKKSKGKVCSGPSDFNGIVSYVNPPIYGPGDPCQGDAKDQTCGAGGDCEWSYDFSGSYGVANSTSCTSGGGGGTGGGTGGQGCNSSSPAPVWSCYQNGINGVGKGNCTWCWAQYNGGGGGGGGTGGSGSCFNNCYGKTGNGSLCTAGCQKDAACVGNCTGSKTKYSSCVMGCVNGTGSGCQDDSDCGNKVCVDGSCVNKDQSHLECVGSSCARVTGAGSNQNGCTAVGATCSGGNTCVDSQCPAGQSCFNNSCQAYHLGCGSDNTCTKVQGTGQSTCTTLGSSCSGGGTCVDSQCATGQACFSGSCKAYHFGCTSSNVCAKLEGAGANTNGCVATGQVCGGELGSCWGNQGVNGRCIDCNGDGIINILDFSCLACNWSEKFTPDQNPSCGTDTND